VIGHLDEGELVISLLFDCLMNGYPGWRWTVSLARADENAEPTVLETELTPGDDSLLAPEWVPWSDRLVEDEDEADADESDEDEDNEDSDEDESDDDESDEDESDDDESDDDESDKDESDDDESDNDESDDDDEAGDDADDSLDALDALDGIDFDEALAAAELNPGETGESESDADHSAPQPPTRSRRARRP
jgi:cobalamin biosynthesis protein CobT